MPSRKQHHPHRLSCPECQRTFRNTSGLTQHRNYAHPRLSSTDARLKIRRNGSYAPPEAGDSNSGCEDDEMATGVHREYHPTLTGTSDNCFRAEVCPHMSGKAIPCDEKGNPLAPNAPPPARPPPSISDWSPYNSRLEFETAEFLFKQEQMSQKKISQLMDLWAASLLPHGGSPPFADYKDMLNVIDSTKLGDIKWDSFAVRYTGEIPAHDPPSWMTDTYEVWFRDPREVARSITANPDFDGEFDYIPFREYARGTQKRRHHDFMSGNWSWKQADEIAVDPATHGAMFVPIILGSDKTTVSVGTGNNEYYPLYMSTGNVRNNVRRAHRNALVLIAFLAIPKTDRKSEGTNAFRRFRRQILHSSISAILQPLRPGMEIPEVMLCPDRHFRRGIFGAGPYVADYPEQVALTCIVQGWCPECLAPHDDLDNCDGLHRSQEHTDFLCENFSLTELWDQYGIVGDVVPFTNDFPRAEIVRLIAPDILHQVIKGGFKDHLVTWVGDYLTITHGEARAEEILDDIDRRIAAAPAFPGLRRFPDGRRFKQWTGDDSKALMKVYIPAIEGHVPPDMVRAFSAYLDFCYLVRKSGITDDDLDAIDDALERYKKYRVIFQTTGVREPGPKGFSLPRQHAIFKFVFLIMQFGAPNGLCSSITESKHIVAVKEPWRRSSRWKALAQMLLTNQRLDKLAASRVDFETRGMLEGTCLSQAADMEGGAAARHRARDGARGTFEDDDEAVVDGPDVSCTRPFALTDTTLPEYRGYPRDIMRLGQYIDQHHDVPNFPDLVGRFLIEQLYPDIDLESVDLPTVSSKIYVFHSAVATFYAPSDISGIGGMRSERIRATPSWRGEGKRYNCVFVNTDPSSPGMRGMHAARVLAFFAFEYGDVHYPCALIHWFTRLGDGPDEDTGMWVVEPEFDATGARHISVVHVDCLVRAAHLLPVFGEGFIPKDIYHADTLDLFEAFYVNKYIDHHAFEIVF
ncbi:hypothetical protein PLICRDRAFT_117609 [Plicaturopsis crispa FD-325 SS-3]|uniref:C2H2-type domain-containing protein n=1 Tax=Plicaturopsis crispa FD-325 SS-3 TaxID=944288 RepID=A0A0C9SKX7_PLICR|nr:hypothetical protein PLICRDRAFT_117609 [Plicaturopsis crispa FD-325 SS-3]